jgi:hypothetical protein
MATDGGTELIRENFPKFELRWFAISMSVLGIIFLEYRLDVLESKD